MQPVELKGTRYLIDGSLVYKSKNGINWSLLVGNADFPIRERASIVTFMDRIWIIGGYSGGDSKNDVWSSTNGKEWTKITDNAEFSPRSNHQVVVFRNKMYLVGGHDKEFFKNDVWSSDNGKEWTQETDHADFSGRAGHQVVVFKNKMYLIGGLGGGYRNDVWSSIEGKLWMLEKANAKFSGRWNHQVVVFKNKMYLTGGQDKKESKYGLFKSKNGKSWKKKCRTKHIEETVVFDNVIYAIFKYQDYCTQKVKRGVIFSEDGWWWRRTNYFQELHDKKLKKDALAKEEHEKYENMKSDLEHIKALEELLEMLKKLLD